MALIHPVITHSNVVHPILAGASTSPVSSRHRNHLWRDVVDIESFYSQNGHSGTLSESNDEGRLLGIAELSQYATSTDRYVYD